MTTPDEPVDHNPANDPYLHLLMSCEEYEDGDEDLVESYYLAALARTATREPESADRGSAGCSPAEIEAMKPAYGDEDT